LAVEKNQRRKHLPADKFEIRGNRTFDWKGYTDWYRSRAMKTGIRHELFMA